MSAKISFDIKYKDHFDVGVRCKSSDRLPEECFCWDGVCSHPYMTYYHILTTLVTLGQDNIVVKRKIILWPGKTLLKHSYLSETDRADPNIIQIVGMEFHGTTFSF